MTKDRKITGSTGGDDVFVFAEDLPARRRPAVSPKPGNRPSTRKKATRRSGPRPAAGSSEAAARTVARKGSTRLAKAQPKPSAGRGCGSFVMLGLALLVGASGFGIGTLAQAATEMAAPVETAQAVSTPAVRDFTF